MGIALADRDGVPIFKNVLCAVDFSQCSHDALEAASDLTARSGGALTIVHVWRQPMYEGVEYPTSQDLGDANRTDSDASMADYEASARQRGVGTVHARVSNGEAWSEIVNMLTADRSFDLAVVGTHGRTGLKRVVLGSVAEMIVRHAPCAVLVIR